MEGRGGVRNIGVYDLVWSFVLWATNLQARLVYNVLLHNIRNLHPLLTSLPSRVCVERACLDLLMRPLGRARAAATTA